MFDWLSDGGGLWALFTTGFLSATLLPGGSEVTLVLLLNKSSESLMTVVCVATLGNTLGGMTNYWLGRFIPIREQAGPQWERAVGWLQRYGYGALLLSWLPVVGDPLCLAAGWLRLRQRWCWLLIASGKFLRYVVLALITRGVLAL